MNAKKSTARNTTIKMSKVKEKRENLKAAKEKQCAAYRGNAVRPSNFKGEMLAGQKKVA